MFVAGGAPERCGAGGQPQLRNLLHLAACPCPKSRARFRARPIPARQNNRYSVQEVLKQSLRPISRLHAPNPPKRKISEERNTPTRRGRKRILRDLAELVETAGFLPLAC
jgi:hypothetical protein